jgi:GT2 family glycosyltransferase
MNENLGYGKANNIGIKLSVTDYVFILNPDVTLKLSQLNMIFKILKNQNFAIASPIERIDIKKFNFLDNNQLEVDFVKGFAMILNKNKFKGKFFDENIFLYLEEIDLCKRLLSNNQKIYANNYAKITHLGAKSSNLGFEYEKCRSWHWMWSKFYYNKKYKGYIFSFVKTFPTFTFSFLKYFFYKLSGNQKKKEIYKMRLSGLLNSYLLRKSFYRPQI